MSELMFKQGQKVNVIERIQKPGEFGGWDHSSIETEGIFHSCNSEGAFVQVVQGDRLKLYQVPFSDIYIKLENKDK